MKMIYNENKKTAIITTRMLSPLKENLQNLRLSQGSQDFLSRKEKERKFYQT